MSLQESSIDRTHGLQRLGKRRFIMIAAITVILLALVAGSIAYAIFGRGTTTVTITPTSREVSNTYTLSAVTSAPDASRQQVAARLASATTPAQTRTASASGRGTLAATQARGMVVLRNWDTVPKTFDAGMVLPDWSADLVVNCGDAPADMVLDTTVTVPAAVGSAAGYGVAYAPAHVVQPGSAGNIPGADSPSCVYFLWAEGKCNSGFYHHCWTIEPDGSFTGGQNAYHGPIVQQSDITNAANSLISANQPDPQQVLQRQLQPNEQLASAPQCVPQISANQQAGAQATQVKVAVSFSCTGEVYDATGALEMAAGLLSQQAAANPGGAYALAGQIKTTLISAVMGSQGTIALTVSARGVWAYHFTNAQKQQVARLLAGKSLSKATQLATGQPGIASVSIHLPTNQQTLPTDPQQITVIVQAVPAA